MMIRYAIYIILVFLISSCSLFIKDIKETNKSYTEKEYEIIKQRKAFIENSNAFVIHTMKKDVISNYINLPTLSKNMIFVIPVDNLLNKVHYVVNSESKNINIKYHLISGIEYFYDKVNKEVLITYNLPFSYFLKNNIVFETKIVGSLDTEIIEKDIIFDFTYNFMKQPKYFNKNTNNPSFNKTSFDDKNLDSHIKKIMKEEAKRINIERFSNEYQNLYKKLSEEVLNR